MNHSEVSRPIEILLVEDNPGDVQLTKVALHDAKVANNLHIVEDGRSAIRFVRRLAPHEQAPRPDLILLDLNLPGKDGREVLSEMKGDEDLKHIPVVVVTSSEAESDIVRSYKLHANCYVTKPVDFQEFMKVVQAIEEFWLTIVKLPVGS